MDFETNPRYDQSKPSEYQRFAEENIGFRFNHPDLLITALTHRSYVNEHRRSHLVHNERLEFLGDAILEMVTSDFLYRNYQAPEGQMTAWRAALVRTESLSQAGEELGYRSLVRLSRGEKAGVERAKSVIMADCFEAVIGAIYLDQGYRTARTFIYKHIISKFDQILEEQSWRDPKTYLQEITQRLNGTFPQYRTVDSEGPDHDREYDVVVMVSGEDRGTGHGFSKQEAQEKAALEAIKYYKNLVKKGRLSPWILS